MPGHFLRGYTAGSGRACGAAPGSRRSAPPGVTPVAYVLRDPFPGSDDGVAFDTMVETMHDVYGREVTLQADGGSIPLCSVLQETYPLPYSCTQRERRSE